jgi:hypothetical protein
LAVREFVNGLSPTPCHSAHDVQITATILSTARLGVTGALRRSGLEMEAQFCRKATRRHVVRSSEG